MIYKIELIQGPIRARMCGFGEKDRRPIDPPPIIKLILPDETNVKKEFNKLQSFIVHCDLYSDPDTKCSNIKGNNQQNVRNLVGSLVASPQLLLDENDQYGIFFLFLDLSVRTEGKFLLKFTLFCINDSVEATPATQSLFSNMFDVFPPKRFPGMTDSTNLSKAFAKQGVKIAIRKSERGSINQGYQDTIEEEEEGS
ncbi:hypothetical protein K502DRAFT_323379 [Neoconidiobolus thromboides FSU 785]|nr:hypothetical protein K502DRAFT_323379 [Neoconidiobolus thromboides FSU 785]